MAHEAPKPPVQTWGACFGFTAAAGGRPISHPVLCHSHARVRIEGARGAGLKVYDDREVGPSAGDQERPHLRNEARGGAGLIKTLAPEISPDRSFNMKLRQAAALVL
jgi:hypothetical protein